MRFRYWTDLEKAILELYYISEGREVVKRLPGRSEDACSLKAKSMGLFTFKIKNKELTQFQKSQCKIHEKQNKQRICRKYGITEIPDNNVI